MRKLFRVSVVCALFAVLAGTLVSRSSLAQKFSFGGQGQSNQSNSNDDDDDNRGSGRRSGGQGGNQDIQQFQQFFQGGQGGANQGRSSNQQGQFQGQRFQQQQQFQNQQFPQQQQQQFQQQHGGQGGQAFGNWQGGKWQGSRKIQTWTQTFGSNHQPFSSQWYQDHPKAWRYEHPQSNVWVVGNTPGVYAWLGWGEYQQQGHVANYGSSQQFDPTHYGDWYPLGVYSLMAGPGDVGTRIVQLAIDRHGHVAGNYYDMITNSAYNVSGDVKRKSQRVYFALNKNQAVNFRARVGDLMQPYGALTVSLPGGQQQWQFVRLED